MSTVTIDCVPPEVAERFYEQHPGRAEAAMRERHELNARLIARQRRQRTTRTASPAPRQRERRPNGARRVTTRSSARSGDSGGGDSPPAPAAARDAVAAAWIHILRRDQPSVAWEVAGR
jgi:hypothetical protein